MILGYCAHIYKSTTYQEVIETLCGKFVGVICECCIILYMYGTSIAMIIIVGDQFDKGKFCFLLAENYCFCVMKRKIIISGPTKAVVICILASLPVY